MKRIQLILIGVLTFFILFSCEKETLLSVDQTSLSFTDNGGSQTVSLTANKQWAASSNQSWCKVSPSAGEEASSSRITITCDANTTYDERNCTITFTCAEKTSTVNVSQATNNGLLVSQTSYEVTKTAQQLNIQVQANVKFSVEVDNGCKDWVKYNTTKGLTTSTVVLDIAENKTYDSREGKVTIKQDGGSLSSTIIIKQSQLDGLFITTPEYNLSNEKHTLTVEVSTNVEFDVTPEADWVKYVQTKGLNTKQIVLEVAENDTYDQRETKVNVKQKNGDLNGVITIKQDEKYGILVSQSEYDLSNEATTIDVEVKFNVDFDMVIPDNCKSWIKFVSTKALGSKTYTFSIARNATYDYREGSITFKQKKGSLSGSVKVYQSQTDGIIAEKKDYIISADEQQLSIKIASNVDYKVTIDEGCKEWLKQIQTKGLTEEYLSFQVSKNEGDERRGRVLLNSEKIQEEISIIQEAEGYVVFEDDNFKAYCVENFDTNRDGEISITEAKRITHIDVHTDNIISLKGIDNMPNLERLNCFGDYEGRLKYLDVSNNTKLKQLWCFNNKLTNLDISNNTVLEKMQCQGNLLNSLDVSHNLELTDLNCSYNKLTCLDVKKIIVLESLICANCQLTSLDISYNRSLKELACTDNYLTSLDVRNNTALEWLLCDDNQLTSLNISGCTALVYLSCLGNPIVSLNVSGCTSMASLNFDSKQLTALDISGCTSLTELRCFSNQLTSLNVRGCVSLKELDCYSNQLASLDVGDCTSLTDLHCFSNQLTNLDVSQNTALTCLSCGSNQLTSLDVRNNTALEQLFCDNNQLTNLDVSKNTVLADLSCNSNQLTSLDVSNNEELLFLDCGNNKLDYISVSNNIKLTYLLCTLNQLTVLDVSHNTLLRALFCEANKIYDLDVSFNTTLLDLACSYNQISSLDVSHNPSLKSLDCRWILLKSLDVSYNAELTQLNCNNNPYLKEIWLKTGQTIASFNYDTDVAIIKYKD